MVDPDALARAFIAACEDELAAPKPGNVHVFAPGHGMAAKDFSASARAAAGPLTAPGARVGDRILGAVEASWAQVGQNTNLGIVLLCAPLAQAALNHAALTSGGADLRAGVAAVLAGLDRDDADLAFRAILRARPAGLGAAPQHDVAGEARTSLLEAMRAAAHRDRIAFQYANGFSDIFDMGRRSLEASRRAGHDRTMATLLLYLDFLCAFPDSHILRKHGEQAGGQVMSEAREFKLAFVEGRDAASIFAAALQWDRRLKQRGLNPGTSADLTVATLFADYAAGILANADKNG